MNSTVDHSLEDTEQPLDYDAQERFALGKLSVPLSRSSPLVCHICRDLDPRHFKGSALRSGFDGWYEKHPCRYDFSQFGVDLEDIKKSSKNCKPCLLLWNACAASFQQLFVDFVLSSSTKIGLQAAYPGAPLVLYLSDHVLKHGFELEIYQLGGLGDLRTFPAIGTATHTARDTSSPEAFIKLKQWFENCMKSHRYCKIPLLVEFESPTRLLDLHPHDKNNLLDIKLSETTRSGIKYACLSHCWGGIQPLQTTKHNLSEFKETIPWNSLPPTFRDAITITRSLGLRYLWIDSLCIVQDSREDWSKESGKMSTVYFNGVITIAATGAFNSTDGCFSISQPADKRAQIPLLHCKNKFFIRRKLRHSHNRMNPNSTSRAKKIPDPYPLLQRAWFYQERLLSRRMLHFGPDEISWECREYLRCECTLAQHDDTWTDIRKNWKLPFGDERFVDILPHAWYDIVHLYSKMDLTYASDLLPALSGLARRFQELGKGRYVAGLWEDTLLWDLTWQNPHCSGGEERTISRAVPWRAPTWSWASIQGGCYYDPNTSNDAKMDSEISCPMEIIELHYLPKDENIFGEVKAAHLMVRAPMIKLQLIRNSAGIFGYILQHVANLQRHRVTGADKYFLPDYEINVPEDNGQTVDALQIMISGINVRHFLILRLMDRQNQTYERLGYCVSHTTNGIYKKGKRQASDETRYRDELAYLFDQAEEKTVTLV